MNQTAFECHFKAPSINWATLSCTALLKPNFTNHSFAVFHRLRGRPQLACMWSAAIVPTFLKHFALWSTSLPVQFRLKWIFFKHFSFLLQQILMVNSDKTNMKSEFYPEWARKSFNETCLIPTPKTVLKPKGSTLSYFFKRMPLDISCSKNEGKIWKPPSAYFSTACLPEPMVNLASSWNLVRKKRASAGRQPDRPFVGKRENVFLKVRLNNEFQLRADLKVIRSYGSACHVPRLPYLTLTPRFLTQKT